MKSCKYRSLFWGCALVLILLFCQGCNLKFPFPQNISWSPDGKSIAFVSPDDSSLWLWDTRTGEAKRLTGPDRNLKENVQSPMFLPSGKEIIVCAEEEAICRVGIEPPNNATLIDNNVSSLFNITIQGKKMYYIKEAKDKNLSYIMEYDTETDKKQQILELGGEAFSPVPDQTGRRIVFSKEEGLMLFDRDVGTTQSLFSQEKTVALASFWLNNSSIVFMTMKESDQGMEDMSSELVLLSLDDKTTRVLYQDVYLLSFPRLDPEKNLIYMTVVDREQDTIQLARLNLETGAMEFITNDPFGAANAELSPDRKYIAYMTNLESENGVVNILELESKRRSMLWRNEEERIFATAESFYDSGNSLLALSSYRDLMARFPETRLSEMAYFRMMQLYLDQPIYDLDKAFEMLHKLGTASDMIERAAPLFWNKTLFLASDPPEDWIATYATEASKKDFGYNTDLPRDLRGLWVNTGKNRLYIRIDYGAGHDLTGIALQDTLILFDYNSPDTGFRKISETTQWDRGAERMILIRHWLESGEQSQYDLEILNHKGEIICRYLASGFSPANNPVFELVHVLDGETPSVIYSISREMLDLNKPKTVNLQVCTFKGGIESHKHLERERVVNIKGKPVCDVADAFGAENTKERIEKDSSEKGAFGAPFIIKGAAATFEVK